jgi:LysM repeat protein
LRLLAPVAIAVVLVGVIVVVASSGGGGGSGDTEARTVTTRTTPRPIRRFYRVRLGDTLDGIAAKTGVDRERLRALNPRVDPQALQPGMRLKLAP